MSHAVLFLTYLQVPEQLSLAQQAWASLVAQDVGQLEIWAVNNGGSAEAKEWIDTLPNPNNSIIHPVHYEVNWPPTIVVNMMLAEIFEKERYEYVLNIPPDVILRKDTYSQMLKWPRGLVTASQTDDRNVDINIPIEVVAVSECVPMAIALTRRWFYNALMARDGFFNDPQFALYCSDCDMALRMASCGIRGIQTNLPFYHYGSSSHRMLEPEKAQLITGRADIDRRLFENKWGFGVASLEYGQIGFDINFKGEKYG